jgi:pimeloyl-ACP methyl ester carboxylesterase
METEALSLASDGLTIAAQVHWPDAGTPRPLPALVVCHGFGSCKENHTAFADLAAARGWAVLTFDWRGHGASDGCVDSRAINDVGAALAWLRAHPAIDATRIVVRGSSMGGYFAIHAACQWPDVAGCVALNPPDESMLLALLRDARDPSTYFGQWRAAGQGFPRIMGCDFSCWLESNTIRNAVARIAPRPLLLIHCRGDEVVPVQITEELYALAGDPKACWLLEGGDHRFAAQDPDTGTRTLDWLAKHL